MVELGYKFRQIVLDQIYVSLGCFVVVFRLPTELLLRLSLDDG